jgi:hypothetical protein
MTLRSSRTWHFTFVLVIPLFRDLDKRPTQERRGTKRPCHCDSNIRLGVKANLIYASWSVSTI